MDAALCRPRGFTRRARRAGVCLDHLRPARCGAGRPDPTRRRRAAASSGSARDLGSDAAHPGDAGVGRRVRGNAQQRRRRRGRGAGRPHIPAAPSQHPGLGAGRGRAKRRCHAVFARCAGIDPAKPDLPLPDRLHIVVRDAARPRPRGRHQVTVGEDPRRNAPLRAASAIRQGALPPVQGGRSRSTR